MAAPPAKRVRFALDDALTTSARPSENYSGLTTILPSETNSVQQKLLDDAEREAEERFVASSTDARGALLALEEAAAADADAISALVAAETFESNTDGDSGKAAAVRIDGQLLHRDALSRNCAKTAMALRRALDACVDILAISPAVALPLVSKLGCAETIVELISHSDLDVASAAANLLHELTEEPEGDDDASTTEIGDDDRNYQAVVAFARDLLGLDVSPFVADQIENSEAAAPTLLRELVASLEPLARRLDDVTELGKGSADASRVVAVTTLYNALDVISNAIELVEPERACLHIYKFAPSLIPFLLSRIQPRITFDESKALSAELLAVFMQIESLRQTLIAADVNVPGTERTVDRLLVALSAYKDTSVYTLSGADEEEFVANVFNVLCACMLGEDGPNVVAQNQFTESEGLELMLAMIRNAGIARLHALKLLDFVLAENGGACRSLIEECNGLTVFVSTFLSPDPAMKIKKKKRSAVKSAVRSWSASDLQSAEEHMVGALHSLLKTLPPLPSTARARLLLKCGEGKFVLRTVDIFAKYNSSVQRATFAAEEFRQSVRATAERLGDAGNVDEEALDDYVLNQQLDAGLNTLQLIAMIVALLCREVQSASHMRSSAPAESKGIFEAIHTTLSVGVGAIFERIPEQHVDLLLFDRHRHLSQSSLEPGKTMRTEGRNELEDLRNIMARHMSVIKNET